MSFQPAPHTAGAAEIRPYMRFREAAEAYMGSRTFTAPNGELRTLQQSLHTRDDGEELLLLHAFAGPVLRRNAAGGDSSRPPAKVSASALGGCSTVHPTPEASSAAFTVSHEASALVKDSEISSVR